MSIIAKAGSWYHISFKLNGKNLKGYVLGSYIKVQGGSVTTEVTASVTDKSIKLRSKASGSGAYVKAGKEYVTAAKGSKVKIKDDVTKGKQKWYYISLQYSGKTYNGYVKDGSLKVSYGNGIPGIWEEVLKHHFIKMQVKKLLWKVKEAK